MKFALYLIPFLLFAIYIASTEAKRNKNTVIKTNGCTCTCPAGTKVKIQKKTKRWRSEKTKIKKTYTQTQKRVVKKAAKKLIKKYNNAKKFGYRTDGCGKCIHGVVGALTSCPIGDVGCLIPTAGSCIPCTCSVVTSLLIPFLDPVCGLVSLALK